MWNSEREPSVAMSKGVDVGVGMHHRDRLGRDVQHLGCDLRHRRVRALAPCRRSAAVHGDAAVGIDVHRGERGGIGDAGLEADRDAAAAPHRAAAAIERLRSSSSAPRVLSSTFSIAASFIAVPVAWGRPSRKQVLAPELDRVDAELARDQVGVALVGPDELRDAEAAQRARRGQVGVERVRIDRARPRRRRGRAR